MESLIILSHGKARFCDERDKYENDALKSLDFDLRTKLKSFSKLLHIQDAQNDKCLSNQMNK